MGARHYLTEVDGGGWQIWRDAGNLNLGTYGGKANQWLLLLLISWLNLMHMIMKFCSTDLSNYNVLLKPNSWYFARISASLSALLGTAFFGSPEIKCKGTDQVK